MTILQENTSQNPEDHYQIYFDDKLIALHKFITEKSYPQIFVIVDENTKQYCLEKLSNKINSFQVIETKSGELHKTLSTCEQVWNVLLEKNATRHDLVINLGGGVIGDMGGFCAATFKRGMDFIQVPTTLLSQVDASVGGKLGIDFQGFKNNIGVFKNPKAVFIHSDFLQTLPFEELRSGYGEAVKHALISPEGKWEQLQKIEKLSLLKIIPFVENSVRIKAEVVRQDPLENGWRKVLNFGHTIGHAVETHFMNTKDQLLHGEAIAIGMICECFLSKELTGLSEGNLKKIVSHIGQIFGIKKDFLQEKDKMIDIMRQDKKNKMGAINFTLLKNIGEPIIDQEVSPDKIWESLVYYNSLS